MTQSHNLTASIGIPTYNRADGYLRQALQSAIAQDYEPLEIIVSDNCSTDNTQALVHSFDDPRIRYFRQPENIKANDNFNFCLQQAQGAYFLLLHDDDLIDPTFISACMAAANGRTDIGIIRTGTRLIDQNGDVRSEDPNFAEGLSLPDFFEAWLTGKTALYMCSTMFNTQGLKAIDGFHSPTNLFQDVVAEFRLAASHGHANVSSTLASYRRHDANRGDAVRVMAWCEDCRYLLDLMCSLSPDDDQKIHNLGLSWFSRKCYRKAGIIGNPIKRWVTYGRIYRYFNRAVTPIFALKQFDYVFFKQRIKMLLGRS
jgi:glycosyltransferase involved in cell wall biosynthesis